MRKLSTYHPVTRIVISVVSITNKVTRIFISNIIMTVLSKISIKTKVFWYILHFVTLRDFPDRFLIRTSKCVGLTRNPTFPFDHLHFHTLRYNSCFFVIILWSTNCRAWFMLCFIINLMRSFRVCEVEVRIDEVLFDYISKLRILYLDKNL